jgi:dihydrofolate reductase
MRKVVVSEFITLDGVIEDPGGGEGSKHAGWSFQFDTGTDGQRFKFDEVMRAGALLLGRVTYQGFAAAWPSMKDDAGFADKMNGMPKYVVSTTLEAAEWTNSTLIRGDVAAEVARLKQQDGGEILINGSGQLVRTLLGHDLIDEVRLMVFPIVLGSGKHLFDHIEAPAKLRLVDTTPVGPDGVLVLTYQPAPPSNETPTTSQP